MPLDFNVSEASISASVQNIISRSRSALDAIASKTNPTLDDVRALAIIEGYLDDCSPVLFLGYVSPDKAIRDAAKIATMLVADYEIEAAMRADVNEVMKAVAASQSVKDQADQRLLEQILEDYAHNGLGLSTADREIAKGIRQNISSLSLQFSSNLAEDLGGVWFKQDELKGLPEDLYSTWAQRTSAGVQEYKMTFQYPDVGPTIRLASLEQTRKRAWTADNSRVAKVNADLMVKMIQCRQQLATVLGFDTFASMALEGKMAQSSEEVMRFLEDLKDKVVPLGRKETEVLQQVKSSLSNTTAPLREWDRGWALSALLERDFAYNTETISEYFELDHTIHGMLETFETLFTLKFIELTDSNENYNTWHEDVRQFAVWRADSKMFLGWLYMDIFPREGKYGHAANMAIRTRRHDQEGHQVTTATALVCNFSKPSKTKPSLLKHGEVRTLFHELGHGIHGLVMDAVWYRYNHQGAVPLDFSEAPSQLLENWSYSPTVLKSISRHYITGEPLSDTHIESLRRVRRVGQAMSTLRSVALSLFDMQLHTVYNGTETTDLTDLYNSYMRDVALLNIDGLQSMGYTTFEHIMDGYEAGYYSYLYSEVFSADMYETRFRGHEYDVKIGANYRDIVLKAGGSREAKDYVADFLGRDPVSEPFLRAIGLGG